MLNKFKMVNIDASKIWKYYLISSIKNPTIISCDNNCEETFPVKPEGVTDSQKTPSN